jgi:hypothetical protein
MLQLHSLLDRTDLSLMKKIFALLLSAVVTIQAQANTASLTDKNGQLDLNQALRSSTDLKNICGQAFKGQQASTCQAECGRLFNRLQDLSTTLGIPNVQQQSVFNSVRSYLGNMQSCGKVWPNNQAPMAFKPFVDLAQKIQRGQLPKSADAQSQKPTTNAISFGKGNTPPANTPKAVSPFFTLDRFVSKANLPHQCSGFGAAVESCRQACTPVKLAAYELRDAVNGNASASAVKAKAEDIDRLLASCAQHLPSTNASLLEARQINANLMKQPDIFEKWRALGAPPINADNDKNPVVYLNMLAGITRDTLKFCGRGTLQKCSPACETLAKLGADLQQSTGDLRKQSQALDYIEKYADYCAKNNVSPFLPAIIKLAQHVKAHPEFLYSAEQLAAVNKQLESSRQQNSAAPLSAGVPSYPLSTGYTLTPLSTNMRKRMVDDSKDLISIEGAVSNQKALPAIIQIAKQSCNNVDTENCIKACRVVSSYGSDLERLQNDPVAGITRERSNSGVKSLPRGALRFLDKSAICLNFFGSEKQLDDNVKALLQYHAFIESAAPPKQTAPADYTFYASRVEMQQKVAQCTGNGDAACILSCQNALSLTSVFVSRGGVTSLPRTGELEALLDGYIEQCQNTYISSSGDGARIGDTWSNRLKAIDFAAAVNWDNIERMREQRLKQDQQLDPAYQFISQYQPEENAPSELKVVERETALSVDYAAVMDALLTIHNYCPDTGNTRSCPSIDIGRVLYPVATLYDADGLNNNLLGTLNNFVNSLGRSDNAETDSKHRKDGYRLYPTYESISAAIRPEKFKIIDQFVSDILAMKPSVIVSSGHRFYCGDKGKDANNPFMDYESCEFLSALYYRDFERLVSLEKLWVEPVLMKQAQLTESQNNIIFDFLAKQNRTLLNNSEKTSMMPLIISSYLIDYNLYYPQCLKPDAKAYRYEDTKVTDFKNRYGHTLYSSTSSKTRTYSMNLDWAEIYDKIDLRLSESSIGMFTLIDAAHQNSDITKAMEFEYNATRPSARAVLTDLGLVMQRNKCDSAVATKLDTRLQEFSNFRSALGKMAFR